MKINLPKLPKLELLKGRPFFLGKGFIFAAIILALLSYQTYSLYQKTQRLESEKTNSLAQLDGIKTELETLKNQDQIKRNEELQKEIENIQKTYDSAVSVYEELVKLRESSKETDEMEKLFAETLSLLSKRNYADASKTLSTLSAKITEEQNKVTASFTIPENVPTNNAPPGSGYSRQQVSSDAGAFMVSLVAAELGSTRVIVDTASSGTCTNDCPVLPLATYVSRNGAYAGVNGSYFCPASYPSCVGKTNTFDTLLMNKDKVYFNSDNNVYSNNPAVIFGSGYIRFVSAASQWGRNTSIDSMISNYPLLVFNGGVSFGGDDDPKKGSKGARSFVANKGNTVYIGVVHNATVAESARVMKAMGMENALNLDNGGSTALYSGGYKVGPGRDLPNVILFVRK